MQESAQELRLDPATLCARLAAWRSLEGDDEPSGNIEDKEAIESFVDSLFTVCTVDHAVYQPLSLRARTEGCASDVPTTTQVSWPRP